MAMWFFGTYRINLMKFMLIPRGTTLITVESYMTWITFVKNYDLKNDSNFEKHIGTTKLSDWAIKRKSLIHKADAPNQVLAAVFAFSAVGKKNIFSQEVISYCGSPLKQIPRAYSQVGSIAEFPRNVLEHFRDNFRTFYPNASIAAGQFTDHQILGFIESAFPRIWCVLHEGLMRAMCVTESGGIISPATFTAIACPWSVRDPDTLYI